MTAIDTIMTATMGLSVSVQEQIKDATIFEISLGSSRDSSESPTVELASLADEKSLNVGRPGPELEDRTAFCV